MAGSEKGRGAGSRAAAATRGTGTAASTKTKRGPATAGAPTEVEPAPAPARVRTPRQRTAPNHPADPIPDPVVPPAESEQALVVREDEEPWTVEELAELRATLTSDIERLTGEVTEADAEITTLLRDFGDGAGEDQADQGSKTFEREHEMSLANNTRDMLAQAERALERTADGSYGRCESCAKPIGKMRLQAFPRATLCMTCKTREERR